MRVVSGDQSMRFIQSRARSNGYFSLHNWGSASFTPRDCENSIQYWAPLSLEVRRWAGLEQAAASQGREDGVFMATAVGEVEGGKSLPFWVHSTSSPWGQGDGICNQWFKKKKLQHSPVLRCHSLPPGHRAVRHHAQSMDSGVTLATFKSQLYHLQAGWLWLVTWTSYASVSSFINWFDRIVMRIKWVATCKGHRIASVHWAGLTLLYYYDYL